MVTSIKEWAERKTPASEAFQALFNLPPGVVLTCLKFQYLSRPDFQDYGWWVQVQAIEEGRFKYLSTGFGQGVSPEEAFRNAIISLDQTQERERERKKEAETLRKEREAKQAQALSEIERAIDLL